MKEDVCFEVSSPFEPQPIFKEIQKMGELDDNEMHRTFNMGMGFTLVCSPEHKKEVLNHMRSFGVEAKVVGRVVEGSGVSIPKLGLTFP